MSSSIANRTRDILRYVARPSCRHVSTKSNPFPYPTHPNPQPHQIFHLPRSATQQQIKDRYYDLVRIYHPDSPVARKYPAETTEARFRAIARAYDLMRGKRGVAGEPAAAERERRADPTRVFRHRAPRRPHFDATPGDERWKERILLGAMVVAVVGFVVQTHVARQKAVGQVAHGARAGSARAKCSVADDSEALAEPTKAGRSR